MPENELLDEIFETANDRDLKVTAIRDRIRGLFTDAGYGEPDEDDDTEEGEEDDSEY